MKKKAIQDLKRKVQQSDKLLLSLNILREDFESKARLLLELETLLGDLLDMMHDIET